MLFKYIIVVDVSRQDESIVNEPSADFDVTLTNCLGGKIRERSNQNNMALFLKTKTRYYIQSK